MCQGAQRVNDEPCADDVQRHGEIFEHWIESQNFENVECVVSIVCEGEGVYYCVVADSNQSQTCPYSKDSGLP